MEACEIDCPLATMHRMVIRQDVCNQVVDICKGGEEGQDGREVSGED